MNKYLIFLKKGFLFVLGFLIVLYVLQNILFILIHQIDIGDYGVLNKIDNGEINAEILISGSSRSYKGINPLVIEKKTNKKCFNIATIGVGLGVQLPKIKWYLTKNKKPKIIIHDISPFGGAIEKKIYEPYKYLPYLSDDSLYSGLLKIKQDLWKNKYIYPINLTVFNFDFYMKLIHGLISSVQNKENLKNGYFPDHSKWSTSFEMLKRKFPNGINPSVSEEYFEYLNELIEICIKQKIKLFFITTPYYFQIQEIVNKNNSITDLYNSLEKEQNVYFIDYSNIEISKDTHNFYNFTHLNSTGADLFSQILADSILSRNNITN